MKEFQNHELVAINSLVPWSIHFHAESIRTDIEIPALAKNYKRLDFGTIKEEIAKLNTAFCGIDGFGDHAPIEIPDDEMREALFMRETAPKQITAEILQKTLKQKSQKALTEWLNEYFVTVSEKKVLMVYLASLPDEQRDNLPVWYHRMIENHYYEGGTKAAAEEQKTMLNW